MDTQLLHLIEFKYFFCKYNMCGGFTRLVVENTQKLLSFCVYSNTN